MCCAWRQREDTHGVHRNSNSAYSHYAPVPRGKLWANPPSEPSIPGHDIAEVRRKVADAPRWPARDALDTRVHAPRGEGEGSLHSLPKHAWWANAKEQPMRTPVATRQARGVHVSTWKEPWQMATALDPHDLGVAPRSRVYPKESVRRVQKSPFKEPYCRALLKSTMKERCQRALLRSLVKEPFYRAL